MFYAKMFAFRYVELPSLGTKYFAVASFVSPHLAVGAVVGTLHFRLS